jgi:hypothetical protein
MGFVSRRSCCRTGALLPVAGLLLYATLIWLHPALIGVSPLP